MAETKSKSPLYDHRASRRARGEDPDEAHDGKDKSGAEPKGKMPAALAAHAEERRQMHRRHENERRDQHGRHRDALRDLHRRHEAEHEDVSDPDEKLALHRRHEHEHREMSREHHREHHELAGKHEREMHELHQRHEAALGAAMPPVPAAAAGDAAAPGAAPAEGV